MFGEKSFRVRPFQQAWFLGCCAVSVLPCTLLLVVGRTAGHALTFVGLSHMGSCIGQAKAIHCVLYIYVLV